MRCSQERNKNTTFFLLLNELIEIFYWVYTIHLRKEFRWIRISKNFVEINSKWFSFLICCWTELLSSVTSLCKANAANLSAQSKQRNVKNLRMNCIHPPKRLLFPWNFEVCMKKDKLEIASQHFECCNRWRYCGKSHILSST